jgi:hypothetical protein
LAIFILSPVATGGFSKPGLEDCLSSVSAVIDLSQYPKAKYAFPVDPTVIAPYSSFQAFSISLVVFSSIMAVTAACGLKVYSRRLSKGLGLGQVK